MTAKMIMAAARNLKFTDTIPCWTMRGGHFEVAEKLPSKMFNYNKIVVLSTPPLSDKVWIIYQTPHFIRPPYNPGHKSKHFQTTQTRAISIDKNRIVQILL